MGMMVWKKNKWVEAPEWTTENWDAFDEAARAQAALDDAVAYASTGYVSADDLTALDAQSVARFGVSLASHYNQQRALGRASFMVSAAEGAKRSAGMAAWFGEKACGISGTPQEQEPVTVIVDV